MAWLYFPEADKDLSRTVTKPHKPTPKLIQAYVARVQNDVRYQVADGALTKLFELFPQNNNLDEVLVKVTTLNTLYSTNIFGVFDVAQHIVGLKIDTSLNQGLLDVVPKIANVKIGGVHRTVYSFATKYCHWHKPDLYPIYDSYVEKVLWAYQRSESFATFYRYEMSRYPKFSEIVSAFRTYYGLGQVTLRELDKFLWQYGKELF